MHNCVKLVAVAFGNRYLYGIFRDEQSAELTRDALTKYSDALSKMEWRIEPAYIENIGF